MQKRLALRNRRDALNLNQFEVAAAVGMGRDRYVRIELGYTDPTPNERKAIAKALKASASELFGELAGAQR
jgi:transcriptional regulator with XRE-family HTH domain